MTWEDYNPHPAQFARAAVFWIGIGLIAFLILSEFAGGWWRALAAPPALYGFSLIARTIRPSKQAK